jgi:hypothetical protein
LAYRVAILAHVPVPHGERSSTPVHDDGRSQEGVPVEMTTVFFRVASGRVGGAESTMIETPLMPGLSG